ncbi:caspase domain-containing protein [Actinosynnema sp. NPDC053489]|uniref:caspase domain-containing protein n=1 Tax=Actinosynnema sp. NPDC053489 TaxID=3363916 RepID=UPI0037C625C3
MKRALLVGIDHYDHHRDLHGCENDAKALHPLFTRNEDGTLNFHCKLLTRAVTRRQVLDGVRALLADGADFALLYFAGHGVEVNGDVVLTTTDGQGDVLGVRFGEVLELIAGSPVKDVVVILDCCFSGGAGSVALLDSRSALLRTGVSILTASRGDQVSAEDGGRGVFSFHLEGALDGGAADVLGHVTVAGLYAYLTESFGPWDQRPTVKTNVDRLHDLRRCKPSVPLETLRRLPTWFPTPDHELPLDPTYEPDKSRSDLPPHPEHEAVFGQLQVCRANKLVEPVGHQHMYYAAMLGLSCRLTPLGRHYWQMASRGYL